MDVIYQLGPINISQLLEGLPGMQNVAGSSYARGSSFFLKMTVLGKLNCIVFNCLVGLLLIS